MTKRNNNKCTTSATTIVAANPADLGIGVAVSFVVAGRSRGNGPRTGVIVGITGSRRTERYEVQSTDGMRWKVPARMLSLAVLPKDRAAKLMDAGSEWDTQRDASKAKYQDEKRSRYHDHAVELSRRIGAPVFYNKAGHGWFQCTLISVDVEKCTCRVTNPIALAVALFGARRRRTPASAVTCDVRRVRTTKPSGSFYDSLI